MTDPAIFKLVAALKLISEGREKRFRDGHTEMVDLDVGEASEVAREALEAFGAEDQRPYALAVWARNPQGAADMIALVGADRVIAIVPDLDPATTYGSVWLYLNTAPDTVAALIRGIGNPTLFLRTVPKREVG